MRQVRTQLQFERNYYLLPELEAPARDQRITWLVQRSGWSDLDARGLPDYLRFDEDDLLLLKGSHSPGPRGQRSRRF